MMRWSILCLWLVSVQSFASINKLTAFFVVAPRRRIKVVSRRLLNQNQAVKTTSVFALPRAEPQPTAQDPEAMDRNGKKHTRKSTIPAHVDVDPLAGFHAKKQQLWLDLRDTALFPHEALKFVQDQCLNCGDDNQKAVLRRLIDGVLVSPEMFDKIVAQESQATQEYAFTLMYIVEDTHELMASAPSTQQSIPLGRIVECDQRESGDLDLIASAETVIDHQKWLVLDTPRRSRSSELSSAAWLQKQISSLLQFVTTSSMALSSDDFEVSSSGLFLPGPGKVKNAKKSKRDETFSRLGGIAIVCKDRNAFMNMDAILAEFRSVTLVGSLTTASGLCVPGMAGDGTAANQNDAQPSLFSTALILPLDLNIWEAALDARLMETEQDEIDIDDDLQQP